MCNRLIRYRLFFRFFNFVYERSPDKAINLAIHYIRNPERTIDWTIVLDNGKKVKTKIYSDNLKTWQFALSYQWQDRALNKLETLLDEFYPREVPWIDVGANLGMRSLTSLSNKRPVYFVEPNAELNALNKERCMLNRYSDYHFLEFGASDNDGDLVFYVDESSYLSSFDKNAIGTSRIVREGKVPVRKIDTLFFEKLKDPGSAIIKIDTEGHEGNVIEGAREFIKWLSPTMVVEINEKAKHLTSILNPLLEAGYEAYEILYRNQKKFLIKLGRDIIFERYDFMSNNFLLVRNRILERVLDTYC